MGFIIKNNWGPNIEVNEGGTVTLMQDGHGRWHMADAEEAEVVEDMDVQPGTTEEKVVACFKFPNDFTKQKVVDVVGDFYHGSAANLALIEIVLYDHGQLKKRNAHTAFLKALMAWGIIGKVDDEGIKKLSNGMAAKMKSMPPEGYLGWKDKGCVNDRGLCIDIGKQLGDTMRYGR